jgi:hypothetical protein
MKHATMTPLIVKHELVATIEMTVQVFKPVALLPKVIAL